MVKVKEDQIENQKLYQSAITNDLSKQFGQIYAKKMSLKLLETKERMDLNLKIKENEFLKEENEKMVTLIENFKEDLCKSE